MNLSHSASTVGALRASALAPPGSLPRRTSASQSCAMTRACATVSSPNRPSEGLRAARRSVLVSLIFAKKTPWNNPNSKSQIGAARRKTESSFRKHRHMMDARKFLINLLYRAAAQSSAVPG